MADKKVRRQIRLSEVAWRQLDLIAEAVGTSSSGEAVSFLIRHSRSESPISQYQTDNIDAGKRSERLIFRVAGYDKRTLDLIAQSLGGVSRSTAMRHLIREWAEQQRRAVSR